MQNSDDKKRNSLIYQLENYMNEHEILFERIHKVDFPYASETAIEYFQKSAIKFQEYHTVKSKGMKKAFSDIKNFLLTRNRENTVILMLFLYEKPCAYRIMFASDAYGLINDYLIADWAVMSPDYKTIIYADHLQRILALSDNINTKITLQVTVKPKK